MSPDSYIKCIPGIIQLPSPFFSFYFKTNPFSLFHFYFLYFIIYHYIQFLQFLQFLIHPFIRRRRKKKKRRRNHFLLIQSRAPDYIFPLAPSSSSLSFSSPFSLLLQISLSIPSVVPTVRGFPPQPQISLSFHFLLYPSFFSLSIFCCLLRSVRVFVFHPSWRPPALRSP